MQNKVLETEEYADPSQNITTYYVRDASGNTMGIYHGTQVMVSGCPVQRYELDQLSLYGSDRVGVYRPQEKVVEQVALQCLSNGISRTATPASIYTRGMGLKEYELKDHLGNVRVTISDIKNSVLTGPANDPGSYTADLRSASNYYPFGMKMPGRSHNFMTAPNNGSGYRYGYNGKEQDFSFHGADGQVLDYGMRMYDVRIARFFNMDPMAASFADLTPFQYASNNPIHNIDLDGMEGTGYDQNLDRWMTELGKGKITSEQYEKRIFATGLGGMAGLAGLGMVETGGRIGPLLQRAIVTYGAKFAPYSIRIGVAASKYGPEAVGFTAGVLGYDGVFPGGGDELGQLLSKKLILGKAHIIDKYAKSIEESFSMFKEGFGLGIPKVFSPSNQIIQAMYQTVKEGKQIAFDITDVNIEAAKNGFESFSDADRLGNITEWELSKILRDKDLFNNTIFHQKGEQKTAKELGLKLIED
jgi:RHS repeat-associated protein